MSANKEQWGSRVGLVLAMAGNAVGLGNILRFPVQAINNGGGAFIIPYLVSFLVMGIPLLWIEWSMGRFGGKHGNHSTPYIFDSMAKKRWWKYFGVFGIWTNIAVAAYYCYIESWTMSYVYHSLIRTFDGMSQSGVAEFFNHYLEIGVSTTGIPYEAVVFYLICLGLNSWILSRGLAGGVEKAAKIGMPLLIMFGLFLAIRGLTLGTSGASPEYPHADAWAGLNFLWNPQFDSLANPSVWLAAAGQIFFTLSVGMGTIHCYASYVRAKDDIALNAMSAGWMNEFVEVVIGSLIVIPIAAGYLGLDWVIENAGFGMAFQTMPFLFENWGPLGGVLVRAPLLRRDHLVSRDGYPVDGFHAGRVRDEKRTGRVVLRGARPPPRTADGFLLQPGGVRGIRLLGGNGFPRHLRPSGVHPLLLDFRHRPGLARNHQRGGNEGAADLPVYHQVRHAGIPVRRLHRLGVFTAGRRLGGGPIEPVQRIRMAAR